jgi:hypothetical protein
VVRTDTKQKSSTPPDREMELQQNPFVSVIEHPAKEERESMELVFIFISLSF